MSTLPFAWMSMRARSAYLVLGAAAVAVALCSAVAMQALGSALTGSLSRAAVTLADGDVVAYWPVNPPSAERTTAVVHEAIAAGLAQRASASVIEPGRVQTDSGNASRVFIRTVDQAFPLHPQIFARSEGDPQEALNQGQAVLTATTANRLQVSVGDVILVGSTGQQAQPRRVHLGAVTTVKRLVDGDEAFFGTVFVRSPTQPASANEIRFESQQPAALEQFLATRAPASRLTTEAKVVADTAERVRTFVNTMLVLSVSTIVLTGIAVGAIAELEARRRRHEFGILLSVGLTPARVVTVFLAQMGIMGLAGGAVGGLLGTALGGGLFASAAAFLGLPLEDPQVAAAPVLIGPLVGALITAMFSIAAIMAQQGSSPWAKLRDGAQAATPARWRILRPAWMVVCVAVLTVAVTGSTSNLQIPMAFLIFIAAVQGLAYLGLRLLGSLPTRRATSKLVLGNLADSSNHNDRVVALASVCVALATLGLLLGTSVKQSLVTTADHSLGWDVLVTSPAGYRNAEEATRPGANGVTATRGVQAAEAAVEEVNGQPATDLLTAVLTQNAVAQQLLEGGRLQVQGFDPAHDPPIEVTAGTALMAQDDMVLSAPVAEALGLDVGDRLSVTFTGGGTATFTLAGLERRQAVTGHAALVGDSLLRQLAPQAGQTLFIQTQDPDRTAQQIRIHAPQAVVYSSTELLSSADQLVDGLRTFVTIALAISCAAAALVMASTIATSVLTRRRQLGILRAVGATRGKSAALLLAEQAAGNLIGGTIGMLVGLGTYVVGAALAGISPVLDPLAVGGIAFGIVILVMIAMAAALPAVTASPASVLRHE